MGYKDIDRAVERAMYRATGGPRKDPPVPPEDEGEPPEPPRDVCTVCNPRVKEHEKDPVFCESHDLDDLRAKREAMDDREKRAEEEYARQQDRLDER